MRDLVAELIGSPAISACADPVEGEAALRDVVASDELKEVHDEVESLLGRVGQRYTSSRRRIVNTLQAGAGPITIAQILSADASLPQSTVYRNLATLEDAGVVARIATSDEFARYELAEDLTGHHHHLICSDCGDIADLFLDDQIEVELQRALEVAAEISAFRVDAHRLDIVGSCGVCK